VTIAPRKRLRAHRLGAETRGLVGAEPMTRNIFSKSHTPPSAVGMPDVDPPSMPSPRYVPRRVLGRAHGGGNRCQDRPRVEEDGERFRTRRRRQRPFSALGADVGQRHTGASEPRSNGAFAAHPPRPPPSGTRKAFSGVEPEILRRRVRESRSGGNGSKNCPISLLRVRAIQHAEA